MSFVDSSAASRLHRIVPALPALREREERLEALNQLAGHLAHDFNNMLAPILGYLSLIKEDAPPESRTLQYAQAMENSARKTEGLMEAVLLAARPQRRFQLRRCDFALLVENTIAEWTAALPPTALIAVTTSLTPCVLVADESQWRNALQQLLRNARYALATGGTLHLSLTPRILTTTEAADLGVSDVAVVLLTVQDNGCGMSATTQARAFEPFFSTRPKSQGMGMGLAIVHSVTRLHGGQILLDSSEDSGTTLRIWLPTTLNENPEPSVASMAKALASMTPARSKTGKILLVDDDPLVLEVIKACLQRAQLEVHIARDGLEGWRLFRRHADEFSLVITDVTMPTMSGIELVQQIRLLNAAMPVILVSGDTEATRDEKLIRLGANPPPLVRKPFQVRELMELVRSQMR